jgi:DNA polymerase I-like protein with 3'-5' exonuclease and polymerase domains
MADVIRQGIDPHAYTAAMIRGMPLEDFMKLKESHPKEFKRDRQSAKSCNFGIPGGLGAPRLVDYALANYGVSMTLEEAQKFRHKIITEVYPELNEEDGYLASTTQEDLAQSLEVDSIVVFRSAKKYFPRAPARRAYFLAGKVLKNQTAKLRPEDIERVWQFIKDLGILSRQRELQEAARKRQPDHRLYRQFFGHCSPTLTGRLRGGCDYTNSKNNPFQGLAADGAKLALWRLIREGFRVVAFIHDEVLVEVPEASAQEQAKRVEEILVQEMESVLLGRVPVGCEWSVGNAWTK